MRFDDDLRDRQSHSGSVDHKPVFAAAIEFVEDERLFHAVDPTAVVSDVDDDLPVYVFNGDSNIAAFRGVLRSIFE